MADTMRATVASLLKGIDRYNPENLSTLERYVAIQAQENTYDLEANLAVLKLYQFNPSYYQTSVATQILLKALTNLPHTDFSLCKSLLDSVRMEEESLSKVMELSELLETCQFSLFWRVLEEEPDIVHGITAFEDSIRKFICHVISITFQSFDKQLLSAQLGDIPGDSLDQWISKYGWKQLPDSTVFIANQDDIVKTKKITEKISFDGVMDVMAKTVA